MKLLNKRFSLIKAGVPGEDSLVNNLIENPNDPDFVAAIELNQNNLQKAYLEAALLTSDDIEMISEILEVNPATVLCYKLVFYDTTGMSKLDKLSHIDTIEDETERVLKIWSLSEGMDFISWRLGNDVTIEPTAGLNQLFSMCVFKAKEAMFSSNKSISSRESARWVKLSLDIAKLLKLWVVDSKAAVQDLELAIKSIVPDFKGISEL